MKHTHARLLAPVVLLLSNFQFPVSSALAQCTGTWTQRMPAAAPTARGNHAMAYDSARRVAVLFGGGTMGGLNNETWEWDGANWLQRFTLATPTIREDHAMAYDSARGVTVLFGGFAGGPNGETWEWNGSSWTQQMPAVSPSARYAHAMAFDSARGVSVLFGGFDGARDNETWEWNGTNWTQRMPATSPSARNDHAMAYDSARAVTVLFGGQDGAIDDETWEWDGTNWSQKIPAVSPTAREIHAMVYDSARGVTVLFGGVDDQTWEWDGINWTRRLPIPSPSARDEHAMAYDSSRGVTVLFGGRILVGGTKNGETWEWTGPNPAITMQPAARSVAPGQAAAFSISADGFAPLTYRWRRDGSPLSDAGPIAGATTANLTINPTAAADAGSYSCLVTNPCGATASRNAALTISTPPAGCGACGAGMAMMMPLTLIGLVAARRRISTWKRKGAHR